MPQTVRRFLEQSKRGFALLALCLPVLALVIIYPIYPNSWLVGGEIFAPDFKNGVALYVEEGYTVTFTSHLGPFVIDPHSFWLVTDENLCSEILRLCGKIEHYREYNIVYDLMLGGGGETKNEFFPSIFLLTDTIAYKIELLNWENYPAPPFTYMPLRQELLGEPVVNFYRIDLSLKPEDISLYTYVREYFDPDTLNGEYGWGWYSTMSRQDMDALLRLLESVGAENAEKAAEVRE